MEASWDQEPVVKSFAKLKEWSDKGYFNQGFLNVDPGTNVHAALQQSGRDGVRMPSSTETNASQRENSRPAAYGTFPLPDRPYAAPRLRFPSQLQVSAKTPKDEQDAGLLFATYVVAAGHRAADAHASVGFPSATKDVMPDRRRAYPRAVGASGSRRRRPLPPDRSGAAAGGRRGLFRGAGFGACSAR